MSASLSSPRCCQFSIKEIEEATNQFDQTKLLGEGGEAKVYRAEIYIDSNKTLVAIKHFQDKSKEFEREIQTFSKIQHPNLVSLLGYCNESFNQVLVYEYMSNGCLSDYLKKSSTTHLSWLKRLKICLDVARGLEHLHTPTHEYSKGIVHCDVKLGNILIDDNWVGKLYDFGMFKLSQADQEISMMTTAIKGTSGYCAPEYHQYSRVTRTIDVFSFGVVLFQVLCRKSPWDRDDESYYPTDSDDLGLWAQQNIDLQIREEISVDSLNLYTNLLGKSLKIDPSKRPSMEKVVQDLHKAVECQNSLHSQKLTKLPELPVQYTTIPRFVPDSSRRFSIEQINSALLAYSASKMGFSVDDIKEALLFFSTFKRFSIDEIKAATNQLDKTKIIGEGRHTKVFYGEMDIDSNKHPVAVKLLISFYDGFENLIYALSKIQHPNLVPLLGVCTESNHRILVYEYMVNGCLSDYVEAKSVIPWPKLLNICLDIALGIQYLHTDTKDYQKGIVHLNVTSKNILIDKNWVGKLANSMIRTESFEGQDEFMRINTLRDASLHIAPEYSMYNLVTRKVDVYAFGVVLFQVLCGKHFWDRGDESYYFNEEEDLGLWAKQNVNAELKEEISEVCLAIYTHIIRRCLQFDIHKRLTMDDVVIDLQKAIKLQNSHKRADPPILQAKRADPPTQYMYPASYSYPDLITL